jgi:hypothetical protein
MTDTPDGGPAFPPMIKGAPLGMSMRDYFAALTLAGIIAEEGLAREADMKLVDAERCYEMADAMLAARKAKP